MTSPLAALRAQTTPVFPAALAVVVPVVLLGAVAPDALGAAVTGLRTVLVDTLGWTYLLVTTALLLVAVYLGLSRFGQIRLGADDERPEYGVLAWFAMLFSAGMGIGLVFWCVAEPVAHFTAPPVLLLAGGLEAVQTASIVAAFPFMLVLVAAVVSLFLALRDDPGARPLDPYPSEGASASPAPADLHVPLRTGGR